MVVGILSNRKSRRQI